MGLFGFIYPFKFYPEGWHRGNIFVKNICNLPLNSTSSVRDNFLKILLHNFNIVLL